MKYPNFTFVLYYSLPIFISFHTIRMNLIKKYYAALALTLFLSLFTSGLNASTVKGRILDSKTLEPLTGAILYDKNNKAMDDEARLDGSFALKKLNPGKHTIIVQFIGYQTQEKTIVLASTNEVITVDILLEPRNITLNQVEVTAHYDTETAQSARNAEKNADNLLNIIPAKTIQLSPDITVANVLQRVSGVTMQRTMNSGEGEYAIIRGMDKRYNYTLVNGIKIPSPNDKNRYVPMDIFPAELIGHLDVIKALTPDMEGDAIGGAMNLVMKDAPDKLLINANISAGYNKLFMDRPFYQFNSSVVNLQSPGEIHGASYAAQVSDFPILNLKFKAITPFPNVNGGISIGNRFLNNKLGVILSISNQNTNSGSDAFVAVPRAQPNPGTIPGFETRESRMYSTHQNRLGIHNKIDYKLNKNNKISLYNAYFELNKYISRHSEETSLSTGVGNLVVKDRSQTQLERIYTSMLQGNHTLSNQLFADWSAVYSNAWAINPDDVQLQVNSSDPNNPILQSLNHKWQHNTDQDISGYINIMWNPLEHNKNLEIKAGGLYRHKTRLNYYNEYTLDPVFINNAPQVFSTIENAQFKFSGNGANLGSPVNQNDYNVTEDVMAYYGQLKYRLFNKLNILGGVRVEQTKLNYTTPMPVSFVGRSGSQSYMDILPSVHLKYELAANQNLRLSYFSSIARPGFFEVIPYIISGETFDEKGNPYLKRSKAENLDFRYELFPGATEQILAGVFYKNIENPIEYGLVRENGPSSLQLKPLNSEAASNYGFEFVVIKYLGNFGISANYTYTKSVVKVNKLMYERNKQGQLTADSTVTVSRPMQGQADHIANLSLLYKNHKTGLDCQLSLVYTGMYISLISPWYGLDYWSMPGTTLDFSFEQKLSKKNNISIFGKARNLLNSPAVQRILYPSTGINLPQQDDPKSIVVQKEQYGQNFLIGFRYTL